MLLYVFSFVLVFYSTLYLKVAPVICIFPEYRILLAIARIGKVNNRYLEF